MPPTSEPISAIVLLYDPRLTYFWLGLSFVIGLLWGSFFNVCIYRIPMGLSPNRPRRSFCFSCGTPIAWFDNIPLFSWIVLRGRCRHCGAGISPRYFAIELFTGLIFAALWWSSNRPELVQARGFSAAVFWHAAVAGMLIVGAMTDFDHWIIPDGITRGGLVAALVAALVVPFVDSNALVVRAGPFPALRMADFSQPDEVIGALIGKPPRQPPPPRTETWRRPPQSTSRSPRAPQQSAQPQPQSRQNPRSPAAAPAPGEQAFAQRKGGEQNAAVIGHWWEPFANALAGAATGYAMLWGIALLGRIVFRREAMGGGDLKLFAFLGAVFGPFLVVVPLFLSSMIGVVLGISAVLWGALRKRHCPTPEEIIPADCLAEIAILPPPSAAASAESGQSDVSDGPDKSDKPGDLPEAARGAASDAASASAPAAAAPPDESRLLSEYMIYAHKRVPPRQVRHIPFGPSISIAALLLLIFHEPIRAALIAYLLPPFLG